MKQIGILLLSLFLFSNCAFTQSEETFPPDWVSNPPKSKRTFYAVGYGQSRSQSIATNKSQMNAFAEMAMMVCPIGVSVTKEKEDEKKSTNETRKKTVVNITLSDVTIEKKAIQQDEDDRRHPWNDQVPRYRAVR